MSDKLFKERLNRATKEVEAAVEEAVARRGSPHGSRQSAMIPTNPPSRTVTPTPQNSGIQWDSRPEVMPWPAVAVEAVSRQTTTTIDPPQTQTFVGSLPIQSSIAAATATMRLAVGRGGQRSESELKQKIQALEDTVADYERQKFNVMGTFAEYRERVAEREQKLEAEYSSKIISLSEEVLSAKKDFEDRMKQFQALQAKFEREKESALEKLREEHQREIQMLEQRCSESQLLNLEQKYMLEIQRLEEERKSLKSEKERLGDTFESKLRRAQTLYDTELSAAKALYSKELEALQDHEEALKEELLARQEEFKDRVDELQRQFQQSKEELSRCRLEVEVLEMRLKQEEENVAALSKELEDARTETNEALQRLNSVKDELEVTKTRCKRQELEVLQKSNLLDRLESAKSKLEEVIHDLHQEVKSLKGKVEFLENERQNLQMQSESQTQLQSSQVKALEAVLETVSHDKETTKEHYERQVENERQSAEEREYAMKREYSSKLNELERQYQELKDQFDVKIEQQTDVTRRQMEIEHDKRVVELQAENKTLETELETLRTKLHSALMVGTDSSTIKKELEAKEQQIKADQTQINELIAKSGQLRRELDESRVQLTERQTTIDALQKQLEEDAREISVECDFNERHKEQIEQLRAALEAEIREQFKAKEPNNEVKSDERVKEKEDEITRLQEKVALMEAGTNTADNTSTENELAAVREDLERKQSVIETLTTELESARQALDSAEETTKQQLTSLKSQLEAKESEQGELKVNLERELRSQFAEAAAENHVAEEQVFERQLQLIKEEADAKEREQALRVSELETELEQKEERIEGLQDRVKELLGEVDNVGRELERKTEELKTFSKRTDEYIRRREQQQSVAHERKMKNLKSEHDTAAKGFQTSEKALNSELQGMIEKYNRLLEDTGSDRTSDSGDTAKLDQYNKELSAKQEEIENLRVEFQQQFEELKKETQQQTTDEAGAATTGSPCGGIGPKRSFHKHGSMEKRQSLCGDPYEGHMCRRAANMAIYNKWHNIVDKVKDNHYKERSPGANPRPPLPRAKRREKSPASPPNSDADTAIGGGIDTSASQTSLDVTLPSRLLSPSIGSEGGRRQSSSPARPAFLPKGTQKTLPIDKRPAWRF